MQLVNSRAKIQAWIWLESELLNCPSPTAARPFPGLFLLPECSGLDQVPLPVLCSHDPVYFAFMLFTISYKDFIIFHLPSRLWALKGGDALKALLSEAQTASCLSKCILLFSIVIDYSQAHGCPPPAFPCLPCSYVWPHD